MQLDLITKQISNPKAEFKAKDTFHAVFSKWQDFFSTPISTRGVRAAQVGHSLLSTVCALLLLLSLSVQQSFNARTPMFRFASKEL